MKSGKAKSYYAYPVTLNSLVYNLGVLIAIDLGNSEPVAIGYENEYNPQVML